ncbi:hypothetical protein ACX93W_10920 [Paenibacillus sp. CAU 1782]
MQIQQYATDWGSLFAGLSIVLAPTIGDMESAAASGDPRFYRGFFTVEETADTFLRLDGWNKGHVMLNGFNLGRYWVEGPTRTLYVSAPLLRKGSNEIIVFELHGTKSHTVYFTDKPELG